MSRYNGRHKYNQFNPSKLCFGIIHIKYRYFLEVEVDLQELHLLPTKRIAIDIRSLQEYTHFSGSQDNLYMFL